MSWTLEVDKKYVGPFIEIKRIGICRDGKAHTYVGYSGKVIASLEERPLSSLLIPILKELSPFVRYVSMSEFTEDVETLKEALGKLTYVKSDPKVDEILDIPKRGEVKKEKKSAKRKTVVRRKTQPKTS